MLLLKQIQSNTGRKKQKHELEEFYGLLVRHKEN